MSRKLWLANNRLKQLPDSLCDVQNLMHLFVEDNMLSHLPEGLDALPLKKLKVQNNPFVNPTPAWVLRLQC